MPHLPLRKSLLALAIAASSLQAHAITYDLSSGPKSYENETISESLTVTGSLTSNDDVLELSDGTQLQGDLILDAQITANGAQTSSPEGNWASAAEVSGNGWSNAVQVDGQIVNKGSLTSTGLMAQGLAIEYADIEKGVINDGNITVKNGIDLNDVDFDVEGNPSGINIQNANIDGQVLNNGTINVAGDDEADAVGVQILDSDLAEADIVNSATGSITASGEEARGFDLSEVEIKSLTNAGSITSNGTEEALGIWLENVTADDGAITNSGSITVSSSAADSEATGILIDTSNLGAVVNSGTITVKTDKGSDATGIKSDDSFIDGLSNTGTINVTASAGEAVGIQIDESEIDGDLINKGTINAKGGEETIGLELAGFEDHTVVTGSLINEGSISAISSNPLSASSSDADTVGIQLFGADIAEEVRNSGTITAKGGKVAGLQILNSNLADANITNTGEINAEGKIAFGLDLSGVEPATVQSIDNSGTISVNGSERSHGLYIDNVKASGSLNNSGSIIASGNNSSAIRLEMANIADGIHNSGTIKGGTNGILAGDGNAPITITQTAGLIEGGQFAIQGQAGNDISVNLAGGTIRGNIAGVSNIDVTGKATLDAASIDSSVLNLSSKASHLTLAQPHTTLSGDLGMGAGSTLQLDLSTATNADKAVLAVDGKASFADGSHLLLNPVGSDFSVEGKQYILVAADRIDDQGLSVDSNSALLNIDLSKVTDTQVLATVTGKGIDEADDLLGRSGASNNTRAAFMPFYSGVLTQLDANDPVSQAFANADAAELAKLASQLSPQTDGSASVAATGAQGLANGAVSARTSAQRGASSGSPFTQSGVWIQGLSSNSDQGRRDGIAGYDADSYGIAIGIDGKLNDNLTLGVAYSELSTNVKSDGGNKTDVDSHVLTLYSGFEQGDLFVDASLTYGLNDNSAKRYIAGTTAKADYDSSLYGLNLTAGYGLHFDNLTLEPRVAGRYSHVDIDGFREKGSSAALKQSSQSYEVIELGAGARLAALFQAGQGTLEPELSLMAYHDFAADQAQSTSSYVLGGTPFVTTGAKPARDSYEAEFGLTYHLGAVSLGGSYGRVSKADFDADVFQAKVRYDF